MGRQRTNMGIGLRAIRRTNKLEHMLSCVGRRHPESRDRRPFFHRSDCGPRTEAVLFRHAIERDIYLDLMATMDMDPQRCAALAFGKMIVPLQGFVIPLNEEKEIAFNFSFAVLCRQYEHFPHIGLATNLNELDVRNMLSLQKYLNCLHHRSPFLDYRSAVAGHSGFASLHTY